MTQLTNTEFLQRVEKLVGNEYTFLEPYKNRKTKIKVRHNSLDCNNHEYWVTPDKFLGSKHTKGHRCPACAKVRVAKKKMLSQAEFDKRVFKETKQEYLFLEPFNGVDTAIEVLHTLCNQRYKVRPANFLKKHTRCPYCYGNHHKTSSEFSDEFNRLQDSCDYVLLTPYKNATTKVKIKHKACNTVYTVAPYSFLQGHRCPRCTNILRGHATLGEAYIREYLDEHHILYEYPKLFPDLKDKLTLHYDFYIPSYNTLIEYQGNQHKEPVDYFGGVPYLETLVKHDNMKRQYAKDNGYTELEIWYDKAHSKEEIFNYLDKHLMNP